MAEKAMVSPNKWVQVFYEQTVGESTHRIDIPQRFPFNMTEENARKLSLQVTGGSRLARFLFHFILIDILDRKWRENPAEKRCREIFTIKVENGFARRATPDYPRTRLYNEFFPSDSDRDTAEHF
jgi:hypothetical protein